MTRMFPGLTELARSQAGVVSRRQLMALGVEDRVVTRRDLAGLWRVVGPQVVAVHRGDLGRDARWWTAVLHASEVHSADAPTAALCGLTAVEAGGVVGFETRDVHVVIEPGREVDDLHAGSLCIRVHETRLFRKDDIHPVLEPARLRLPRAVVESASDAVRRQPERARALLAAAVQQRLLRGDELRVVAAGRRTLPGRRLILETISDAQGGAHSLPEMELLRGLRRAGLPEPRRQRKLQRADGTWYLDNDFAEFLVTVEVNGLQHYEQTLREADDFRRAVLQIGGRIVVDLSSYAVRHQLARSLLLIAETLVSHGYRPPPTTARRLERLRVSAGWDATTLRAS
jgi:hypothetical protein